jgi:hypothetical protein
MDSIDARNSPALQTICGPEAGEKPATARSLSQSRCLVTAGGPATAGAPVTHACHRGEPSPPTTSIGWMASSAGSSKPHTWA